MFGVSFTQWAAIIAAVGGLIAILKNFQPITQWIARLWRRKRSKIASEESWKTPSDARTMFTEIDRLGKARVVELDGEVGLLRFAGLRPGRADLHAGRIDAIVGGVLDRLGNGLDCHFGLEGEGCYGAGEAVAVASECADGSHSRLLAVWKPPNAASHAHRKEPPAGPDHRRGTGILQRSGREECAAGENSR